MPGKLFVYRGLPGSGKTFLARQHVQDALARGERAINIDRDMFRIAAGFGVAPTGDYEQLITAQQQAIMKHAFVKGWTVIESSTNLRMSFLKEMHKLAYRYGAGFQVLDVDTKIDICIERDIERGKNGGHMVGEAVIRDMHNKFLKKGFPSIQPIQEIPWLEKYENDESLPEAIIVDIDGTVAQVNGRSPYDYTQVHTDLPKLWVIDEVLDQYYARNRDIIFMSGREASCRDATREWLSQHFPCKFELFMRGENDDRMDAIVKLELFEKHIRGKYNVKLCIDDRRQVIDAYRHIGLNVIDVAGHEF